MTFLMNYVKSASCLFLFTATGIFHVFYVLSKKLCPGVSMIDSFLPTQNDFDFLSDFYSHDIHLLTAFLFLSISASIF